LSTATDVIARRVSVVALAIWGLSTTLSSVSSAGCSFGSPSNTSSAAPARRRSRNAAASAASSTMPPRATLTSIAVGFIRASSAAPMACRVRGVSGKASTRKSDSPSNCALSTWRALQARSTASGSGERLW